MQPKGKVQRKPAPNQKQNISTPDKAQTEDLDLQPLEADIKGLHLGIHNNSGAVGPASTALTPSTLLQLQRTIGNKAVSRLIAREVNERKAQPSLEKPQKSGSRGSAKPTIQRKPAAKTPASSKTIQRTYATLSPMAKARVDQQSDEKYSEKTQEFEFKMAPAIMENAEVNKVVDVMLGRVHRIVKAWAESTGRELRASYEREFGWKGGDDYYGAFEMTADNITTAFTDKSQPMRTKLKLVYNAVRNNNLSKWLKVAATELDTKARGKKATAQKIKTSTGNVVDSKTKKVKKNVAEKEEVQAGFAEKSGISSWMTPEMRKSIMETNTKEKMTDKSSSKRDVFGHDRFSGVMGWKASTSKANSERKGGASSGLALSEQRTLGTKDVSDLTDAEIDFMYKRQNKPVPDKTEKDRFRNDPTAKLDWGQGGEFYEVNLGSDSAKEAAEIKARMEAGISGSTDLMLHAMENLGIGGVPSLMKGMRLALAGWMLANRDHSFYEIYKAAESYGVAFDIDKAAPGKEYESAANLAPMKPADFQDLLPEHEFPRYFLSTAYKDTLSNSLEDPTKGEDQFKASLLSQGINSTLLNSMTAKDTAELGRLAELVQKQGINSGDRWAKKQQAVRQLRLSSAFIYLGNKFGMDPAKAMLNALLGTHHGGKGLVTGGTDKVKTLADAGIPRVFLTNQPETEIKQLEVVRQAVMQAGLNPTTKAFNAVPVNKEIAKLKRFQPGQLQTIKAVLIKTYYGSEVLSESEQLQANAAQMMAGHEEGGVKKLTTAQLNALQPPTSQEGTKIKDRDYFESASARKKLQDNLSIMAKGYLQKLGGNNTEKDRIRNAIFTQIGGNDQEFIKDFKQLEKDEGFVDAVSAYSTPDFIKNVILPASDKEALTGLEGLHDKELGSIFQYTTALYKPIVNSSNSFATTDFKTADTKNTAWGSPLATLKYTGPMMQGLSSGLAKLPVYAAKVYRLDTTAQPLLNMSQTERANYARQKYPVGSIQTQNYPMSTSKTLNSQFAATNYGNPSFSVVYEIDQIKSGHDIQFVSDKVNEEEVLFAPGSRLQVVSVTPHKPGDPSDKHIWVKLVEI